MQEERNYQVAVHTGDNRRFHPEPTFPAALDYTARAAQGEADYIAIEQWRDTANGCTGGWLVVEIVRDRLGYFASTALSA